MIIEPTAINDVKLIVPRVISDSRGCFFESFNDRVFMEKVTDNVRFVQDNHSRSTFGVLRGLHFQTSPHPQGKLVRATVGRVFDVAVDIRPESKTYGQWVGEELSAENCKQLWIPAGFAHGFVVLSETAEVQYKTTDFWAAQCERCIRWDDPAIGIEWPIDFEPITSPKDAIGMSLHDAVFGTQETTPKRVAA